MKNIRDNLILLGEGIKDNPTSQSTIYWRGYNIKIKELNDKVIIVEIFNDKESSERIVPINKDEYHYLSKCLNNFNKNHT